MAAYSSEFFRQKLSKKRLILELEENDDVLGSLKQAMKNHGLKECSVELMEGTIKTGKMTAVVGSSIRSIQFNNSVVINASGHFKLSFDELFGSLHVLAKIGKPETGTLISAKSAGGMKIVLGFYE